MLLLPILILAAELPNPVHKQLLQDLPFPAPAYHTITVHTVVDAGGVVPRHVHPGIEMAYVIDGRGTLALAGQPERVIGAGDSFAIPENTAHSVRNIGTGPITIVSTYVVARDRPVMIPQP